MDSNVIAFPSKDGLYLSKLQDYYARWKSLPSYNRLTEILGLASRSAVGKVLARLQTEGFLMRTPDEVWVPTRRFFERPLSEFRVPAGAPAIAQEVNADSLMIDDYLIDQPSRTALVPVRGDSMVDAGIFDGDIAVVEKRERAKSGDIVVALIDNELTLKTLDQDKHAQAWLLKPANAAYGILRPQGELKIFGVVVGLIRKYRRP